MDTPVLLPILLSDSLELTSWLHANATHHISELFLAPSFAYISIDFPLLLEYVYTGLLAVSSLIMHLSITEEVYGARLRERPHPRNDVCFSWPEQDVCTNTSLRFVRAISLRRVNCG